MILWNVQNCLHNDTAKGESSAAVFHRLNYLRSDGGADLVMMKAVGHQIILIGASDISKWSLEASLPTQITY